MLLLRSRQKNPSASFVLSMRPTFPFENYRFDVYYSGIAPDGKAAAAGYIDGEPGKARS